MMPFFSGTTAIQTYDALVEDLKHASWIEGFSASPEHMVSAAAPLSDKGYHKVLRTGSLAEMELFVRRVVAARNATVDDDSALRNALSMWASTIPPSNLE